MRYLFPLLLAVCASCAETVIPPVCNGSSGLCEKTYEEVTYLTTHNAYNYATGGPVAYQGPNQDLPINDQLEFGVRAFMLDVYPNPAATPEEPGIPWVYHVFPIFGNEPLTNSLTEISEFLQNNPTEIITLILECYVGVEGIEASLESTGLLNRLYTHDPSTGWPTLQSMIDSEQNLVILTDCEDNEGRQWYHYVWDLAVETPFSNSSRSDFNCEFLRGEPENDLFILNHFLTTPDLGLGDRDSSIVANSMPFVLDRTRECEAGTGKKVNFLTVDFYAEGDLLEALEILNED